MGIVKQASDSAGKSSPTTTSTCKGWDSPDDYYFWRSYWHPLQILDQKVQKAEPTQISLNFCWLEWYGIKSCTGKETISRFGGHHKIFTGKYRILRDWYKKEGGIPGTNTPQEKLLSNCRIWTKILMFFQHRTEKKRLAHSEIMWAEHR